MTCITANKSKYKPFNVNSNHDGLNTRNNWYTTPLIFNLDYFSIRFIYEILLILNNWYIFLLSPFFPFCLSKSVLYKSTVIVWFQMRAVPQWMVMIYRNYSRRWTIGASYEWNIDWFMLYVMCCTGFFFSSMYSLQCPIAMI